MLKKIVVIGPESTGKSTLCAQLAEHYHTPWCPEYAREYLLKNGTTYDYNDLLTIAKGQVALEDRYTVRAKEDIQAGKGPYRDSPIPAETTGHKPQKERSEIPQARLRRDGRINDQMLFVDTDMYVMKVWCEFVFGNCHRWILEQISERKYDLYLLCNTELPWVKDELREYPDLATREELFRIYKDIMINQSTPWVEISTGRYEERFLQATRAVDQYLP